MAGLLAPWPLQVLIDNVLGEQPLAPALAFLVGPLGASNLIVVSDGDHIQTDLFGAC
jgi:hypothetical protein